MRLLVLHQFSSIKSNVYFKKKVLLIKKHVSKGFQKCHDGSQFFLALRLMKIPGSLEEHIGFIEVFQCGLCRLLGIHLWFYDSLSINAVW